MKTYRNTALTVGIFFIVGDLAGIASGLIHSSLAMEPSFPLNIAASGSEWVLSAILILIMGLPLAMIPVVLYPLFKKQNEVLAQGAILFRGVLEAVCYLAMTVCTLCVLSVVQSNTDQANMQFLVSQLNDAKTWIELILAIVFSMGSFMISTLLYQTRVIPRWLSGWGIAGAGIYFIAPFISLLSPAHPAFGFESMIGFMIAPLAGQEITFALWAIVKGFKQPVYTESV